MSNRSQPQFPCQQTRREFVWQMGGGFAGLALTDLLTRDRFAERLLAQERAVGGGRAAAADGVAVKTGRGANPLASREPHFAARAKSVIFLMMNSFTIRNKENETARYYLFLQFL